MSVTIVVKKAKHSLNYVLKQAFFVFYTYKHVSWTCGWLYCVSGASVLSWLFLLRIKVTAQHLWLLWMWLESKQVRESSRKMCPSVRMFPLLSFSHLKMSVLMNMKQQTSYSHTHHTHNNCKHSRVWISHFLMSNISLGFHGNGRRGAAVSMPPPPSRRRDRRHPIMNTQITKTVSHHSSSRQLSLSSVTSSLFSQSTSQSFSLSSCLFVSPLLCGSKPS